MSLPSMQAAPGSSAALFCFTDLDFLDELLGISFMDNEQKTHSIDLAGVVPQKRERLYTTRTNSPPPNTVLSWYPERTMEY